MNAYDLKWQRYKIHVQRSVPAPTSSPGTIKVIGLLRILPERYYTYTGKEVCVFFLPSPADQCTLPASWRVLFFTALQYCIGLVYILIVFSCLQL